MTTVEIDGSIQGLTIDGVKWGPVVTESEIAEIAEDAIGQDAIVEAIAENLVDEEETEEVDDRAWELAFSTFFPAMWGASDRALKDREDLIHPTPTGGVFTEINTDEECLQKGKHRVEWVQIAKDAMPQGLVIRAKGSFKITDPKFTNQNDNFIVFQLHGGKVNGEYLSPPVAIVMRKGRMLEVRVNYGKPVVIDGKLKKSQKRYPSEGEALPVGWEPDKFTEFEIELLHHPTDGYAKVWFDGVLCVDHSGGCGYVGGDGMYAKGGAYNLRDTESKTTNFRNRIGSWKVEHGLCEIEVLR